MWLKSSSNDGEGVGVIVGVGVGGGVRTGNSWVEPLMVAYSPHAQQKSAPESVICLPRRSG